MINTDGDTQTCKLNPWDRQREKGRQRETRRERDCTRNGQAQIKLQPWLRSCFQIDRARQGRNAREKGGKNECGERKQRASSRLLTSIPFVFSSLKEHVMDHIKSYQAHGITMETTEREPDGVYEFIHACVCVDELNAKTKGGRGKLRERYMQLQVVTASHHSADSFPVSAHPVKFYTLHVLKFSHFPPSCLFCDM